MIRVSIIICRPQGENAPWDSLVAWAKQEAITARLAQYEHEVEILQLHFTHNEIRLPHGTTSVPVDHNAFIRDLPTLHGEHVVCVLSGRSVVVAWAMARLAAELLAETWTFDDRGRKRVLIPVYRQPTPSEGPRTAVHVPRAREYKQRRQPCHTSSR